MCPHVQNTKRRLVPYSKGDKIVVAGVGSVETVSTLPSGSQQQVDRGILIHVVDGVLLWSGLVYSNILLKGDLF